MKYWFGCRVFDKAIDKSPGHWQLEGPYGSLHAAETAKLEVKESDMQVSDIFTAQSEAEAKKELESV